MMPAGSPGGSPTDLLTAWQADAVGLGKCWAQEDGKPGLQATGTRSAEAAGKKAKAS